MLIYPDPFIFTAFLALPYETRVVVCDSDQHSSLLRYGINGRESAMNRALDGSTYPG